MCSAVGVVTACTLPASLATSLSLWRPSCLTSNSAACFCGWLTPAPAAPAPGVQVPVDYVLQMGGYELDKVERELNATLRWGMDA